MTSLAMTTIEPTVSATEDPRWEAVRRRDPGADGQFFYSVATTGVYCRPSCAARLPNRRNVAFHASCAAAERAGFRPCKRCRPNEPSLAERHAAAVAAACRLIEAAEEPPTLEALAAAAGLSPHHFHRLFKAITGVTPKAYAGARRARRVQDGADPGRPGHHCHLRCRLQLEQPVLRAVPGGPRHDARRISRRRPRRGHPLRGRPVLAGLDPGGGHRQRRLRDPVRRRSDALVRELQDRFPKAELVGGDAGFERLVAQVVGLVEAPRRAPDLPLDIRGTAFQERVWQALRAIPAGLDRELRRDRRPDRQPQGRARGGPGLCRQPGGRGHPLPPRGADRRRARGYRWGVERKRELLRREA